MGRRQASVMFWSVVMISIISIMVLLETLDPGFHVDVTLTHTTLQDCCRPHTSFHGSVFPDDSGLFQQDNESCHTAEIVQELFEEHDNEFKLSFSKLGPGEPGWFSIYVIQRACVLVFSFYVIINCWSSVPILKNASTEESWKFPDVFLISRMHWVQT